jgi:hypothetical protein
MKGTLIDFLNLAAENPDLAKELVELAARYDFEFTNEELSDEELEGVAGGTARAGMTIGTTNGVVDLLQQAIADSRASFESGMSLKAKIADRRLQNEKKLD